MNTLFNHLLNGKYLRPSVNHNGDRGFKLYEDRQRVLKFYSYKNSEVKRIYDLLRKDEKGRYVLNLVSVRRLHGNDARKRIYKKTRTKKNTSKSSEKCHPSEFKIEKTKPSQAVPGI